MGSQESREEKISCSGNQEESRAGPPPPPLALLLKDPPFIFNLTHGELVQRQRLIEEELRRRGCSPCHHGGDRHLKNDHTLIIDCVNRALRHYNANNPGAEFDPSKALMYSAVAFRQAAWIHVSFLARRRSTESSSTCAAELTADDSSAKGGNRRSRKRSKAPADCPDKHFFAELCFDNFNTMTVVTCRIIEKTTPHSFKTKCEFCPASFEILHPGDGKFVCGKRDQRNEMYKLRNRLQQPYTWPKEEAERSHEHMTSRTRQDQPGLLSVYQNALDICNKFSPRSLLSLVSKLWPGAHVTFSC